MTKKTKNHLLSLGSVVMVVTPVATVVACSSEDTNISALEILEKDGASLQSILGAGASSETYASVVSVDDIVTALNETEGISGITSDSVAIVDGDDLKGVLTFTVTYEEIEYEITVEEFAIDTDAVKEAEIVKIFDLIVNQTGVEINVTEYLIFEDYFGSELPLPSVITNDDVKQMLISLGLPEDDAGALSRFLILDPDDSAGKLHIYLSETFVSQVGFPIDFTLTGLSTT